MGEKLNISAAHVLGVVTFYPGLRQMCPGKNHIRVCRTLSCAMAGADSLFDAICTRLGIDKNGIDHHHPIGVSPDGLWSVEGVECLANCGFGPNMMVNDLLYEKSHSGSAGRSDCQISDSLTLSISHAPDFRHEHHLSSR